MNQITNAITLNSAKRTSKLRIQMVTCSKLPFNDLIQSRIVTYKP